MVVIDAVPALRATLDRRRLILPECAAWRVVEVGADGGPSPCSEYGLGKHPARGQESSGICAVEPARPRRSGTVSRARLGTSCRHICGNSAAHPRSAFVAKQPSPPCSQSIQRVGILELKPPAPIDRPGDFRNYWHRKTANPAGQPAAPARIFSNTSPRSDPAEDIEPAVWRRLD